VRVLNDAALGKAKVHLSYSDWKDRQVLPGVFSIEVKDK
jgi:hypothetical protein